MSEAEITTTMRTNNIIKLRESSTCDEVRKATEYKHDRKRLSRTSATLEMKCNRSTRATYNAPAYKPSP